MIHAGAEFAERIADALECRAHLLFECDAAFVRRQWYANLSGNEDPGAGRRIDAQCLAEGRRDRTWQVFDKIHGVTPDSTVVQSFPASSSARHARTLARVCSVAFVCFMLTRPLYLLQLRNTL